MSKKIVVYENGMPVKPTQKITLAEGVATVKEILEDFRILIQFDDPKVRPNFRELQPNEIGAKVVELELPKPPLGLRPRFIWVAARIEEIREAITRYEAAKHQVPRAWRSELAALENSVFVPITEPTEDINEFTQHVQYQPAYSVEQLNQMSKDVLPFLEGLGDIDVEVIDGQLVNVARNQNDVLTAKFEGKQKNFAYLCAFLLNNARNILLKRV